MVSFLFGLLLADDIRPFLFHILKSVFISVFPDKWLGFPPSVLNLPGLDPQNRKGLVSRNFSFAPFPSNRPFGMFQFCSFETRSFQDLLSLVIVQIKCTSRFVPLVMVSCLILAFVVIESLDRELLVFPAQANRHSNRCSGVYTECHRVFAGFHAYEAYPPIWVVPIHIRLFVFAFSSFWDCAVDERRWVGWGIADASKSVSCFMRPCRIQNVTATTGETFSKDVYHRLWFFQSWLQLVVYRFLFILGILLRNIKVYYIIFIFERYATESFMRKNNPHIHFDRSRLKVEGRSQQAVFSNRRKSDHTRCDTKKYIESSTNFSQVNKSAERSALAIIVDWLAPNYFKERNSEIVMNAFFAVGILDLLLSLMG